MPNIEVIVTIRGIPLERSMQILDLLKGTVPAPTVEQVKTTDTPRKPDLPTLEEVMKDLDEREKELDKPKRRPRAERGHSTYFHYAPVPGTMHLEWKDTQDGHVDLRYQNTRVKLSWRNAVTLSIIRNKQDRKAEIFKILGNEASNGSRITAVNQFVQAIIDERITAPITVEELIL